MKYVIYLYLELKFPEKSQATYLDNIFVVGRASKTDVVDLCQVIPCSLVDDNFLPLRTKISESECCCRCRVLPVHPELAVLSIRQNIWSLQHQDAPKITRIFNLPRLDLHQTSLELLPHP